MQAASSRCSRSTSNADRDQRPHRRRHVALADVRARRSNSRGCRPGRRRGGYWRAPARRPARCPRCGTGRTDRPDRSACPRHSAAAAGGTPARVRSSAGQVGSHGVRNLRLASRNSAQAAKSAICGARSTHALARRSGGSGSGALERAKQRHASTLDFKHARRVETFHDCRGALKPLAGAERGDRRVGARASCSSGRRGRSRGSLRRSGRWSPRSAAAGHR